ncbi:MAG: hypothetical protein ACOY46_08305 [Bacillota bacterium]
MQFIKLLLIIENQALRRSLASLFARQANYRLVGEFGALIIHKVQELQPDVVLYSLSGNDEKSLDPIRAIKEVCPCTMTIVISPQCARTDVRKVFQAGAHSYLKTPLLPADLILAVDLACRGEIFLLPGSSSYPGIS